MGRLSIPVNLAQAARREGRDAWLETLPATVETLAQRWRLAVGEPFQPGGVTAWVAPATSTAGRDLVLKLVWPHPEGADEAVGLRFWAGNGAVYVYATEDLGHTIALLLERCRPGTALSTEPETAQDEILVSLLRRLWREPAPGQLRPLQEMCDQWANEFETKAAGGQSPLDPGLIRAGIELFRLLPTTAERSAALCTDLHAGNVLASQREPWLVIDPKPYVGDPTYDLLQHMLNCPSRLHSDPVKFLERIANLAGVDPGRARLWLFGRCVVESADCPGLAEVARLIAPP